MAQDISAAPWNPRRIAIRGLLVASLAFALAGVARAEMIATEQAVNATASDDSDSALASSRRSGVERELRALGVARKSANARVAAMTDEEVRAVVEKLDSLPAAGQYVPPPVVAAAGAGGTSGLGAGYIAAGGGYGGGGGVAIVLISGLVAILNWNSIHTNAANPNYLASTPPPLDPDRKISEQDCTKPIARFDGNLRCK